MTATATAPRLAAAGGIELPVAPGKVPKFLGEQGACRDLTPEESDAFYPPKDHRLPAQVAATCRRCPVRVDCAIWAVVGGVPHEHPRSTNSGGEEHGIWGGLTPAARRDLRATGRELGLSRADLAILVTWHLEDL